MDGHMHDMKTGEIRFECRRCGMCCSWHGYVRLSEKEADTIASHIGMAPSEFYEKMVVLTHDRRGISLAENDDGTCIFYDPAVKGCRIYCCRPEQCRSYPLKWHNPRNPCPGFRNETQEARPEKKN